MNTFDKEKLEHFFNEEAGNEDAGFVQEIFTDENRKTSLQPFLSHQWNCFLDNADIPEKDLTPVLHKIHFRLNLERNRQKV
jgi:hypothetical protein